jgi:nitrite reductase/ring-hydroxylating ferredoxin subunit/uncharacterized membrane protein
MAEPTALTIIDHQEWLDPLADQVQTAVTGAFESAGAAGQAAKNFLHGTWLGHPLHPVLTDVPIGAWTAALVMDAMEDITGERGLRKGADAAIAVGLVGAVASAVTGLADWSASDGRARKVGLMHGLLNLGGAVLYGASLALRKSDRRAAGRGCSTLGYAVMMASAYLGGELVYSEQMGVNHSLGQPLPKEFVPVLPEAELAEGQLRRVEANGARILLAKRNGQIYAMNEVCSHLGGPLAEGEMVDCSVRCPWHGSRFSLEDGSVIDGPATHPQPTLHVRVREGQIEVAQREEPLLG